MENPCMSNTNETQSVAWPIRLTPSERSRIERLHTLHRGLVSRSAILRGLLLQGLRAAEKEPERAIEHLLLAPDPDSEK